MRLLRFTKKQKNTKGNHFLNIEMKKIKEERELNKIKNKIKEEEKKKEIRINFFGIIKFKEYNIEKYNLKGGMFFSIFLEENKITIKQDKDGISLKFGKDKKLELNISKLVKESNFNYNFKLLKSVEKNIVEGKLVVVFNF